jgi:hypothetical protein
MFESCERAVAGRDGEFEGGAMEVMFVIWCSEWIET